MKFLRPFHALKCFYPAIVAIMALLPGNTIAQSVDPEPPVAAPAVDKVQVWLTTYDTTKKLQKQADLTWSGTQPAADFNVPVDESIKYQQMDGFGATITDPAIWNADPAVREEIMRLLFSREQRHRPEHDARGDADEEPVRRGHDL